MFRQDFGKRLLAALLVIGGVVLIRPEAQAEGGFLKSAEKSEVSPAEMVRLRKGEVVVTEQPRKDAGEMRFVIAKILIGRPAERVWGALQDQETLFQGEPHMKRVRQVGGEPPEVQDVAYVLAISKFLPTFNYVTRIRFAQPAWTARFDRLRGSFKAFKGFARLKPVEGGQKTVMVYALQLDPGFFIPQFVIRSILKAELPGVLSHIKKRVEGQSVNPAPSTPKG